MQQVCIAVKDLSQVGEARRAGAALASRIGLGETDAGKVGIVITELATNLVRYGKEGKILLRPCEGQVEVLALDAGPGMDVGKCLVDGYSTGGTPGNGLGAVRRMASAFDLYSKDGAGTVVVANVGGNGGKRTGKMRWGCVNLPAPGEQMCGDACGFHERDGVGAMMIADGLGHGPDAAKAANATARVFEAEPFASGGDFLQASHQAMTGTRGAAVAIARIDWQNKVLKYAGVGNIAGMMFAGGAHRGLVTHNGTVGAILPRVQVFDYPLEASGMIVMHSDGLQTRWSLESYPGLAGHHPAVVAGVLFRDFYRGRDDVTVLVGAWQGGSA